MGQALYTRQIARYTAQRSEAYGAALSHARQARDCVTFGWYREAQIHRDAMRAAASSYRDLRSVIADLRALTR